MDCQDDVLMREVVTLWRLELAALRDRMTGLILANADPEVQYSIARSTSEDITYAVTLALREKYGRVIDPILDGPRVSAD